MKTLILSLLMIPLLPIDALAGHRHYSQSGYSRDVKCYRDVYREEYVPGTRHRPGYVRTYTKKKEIPCRRSYRPTYINPHGVETNKHTYKPTRGKVDDNSCIEGSILGGIGGAGLGAALSRGDGRLWAIPLGIVGGAMVGCQVDGG